MTTNKGKKLKNIRWPRVSAEHYLPALNPLNHDAKGLLAVLHGDAFKPRKLQARQQMTPIMLIRDETLRIYYDNLTVLHVFYVEYRISHQFSLRRLQKIVLCEASNTTLIPIILSSFLPFVFFLS
jgi:hypothetical protein